MARNVKTNLTLQLSVTLFAVLNFRFVFGDKTLVQTNLVYRHGDRSPIDIYPKDMHTADSWSMGLGALTPKGARQQTRLGRFFRSRYDSLIDDKFNYKQIYVRSSDVDRTLLSAYSNLAGLYSIDETPVWKGDFASWQPIPVHTVASSSDEVLRMCRPCHLLDNYLSNQFMEETRQVNRNLASFLSLVLQKTGLPDNYTWHDIDHLKDTLFCEKQHNMTWPDWALFKNVTCPNEKRIVCSGRTVYDILSQYQNLIYKIRYRSELVHKFMGGPLLTDMIKNMNNFIIKNTTVTFYMYSAHDTTLAALLSAVIGEFNFKLPQYASAVMLELYKEDKGDNYYVEVHYKNVTDSVTVIQLTVPGCGKSCRLDDFSSLYSKYNIGEWDTACHNQGLRRSTSLSKGEIITICMCLIVVLGAILIALVCYMKRQRNSNSQYRLIPL